MFQMSFSFVFRILRKFSICWIVCVADTSARCAFSFSFRQYALIGFLLLHVLIRISNGKERILVCGKRFILTRRENQLPLGVLSMDEYTNTRITTTYIKYEYNYVYYVLFDLWQRSCLLLSGCPSINTYIYI